MEKICGLDKLKAVTSGSNCFDNMHNPVKSTGNHLLNPRVPISEVIIKHLLNLDD